MKNTIRHAFLLLVTSIVLRMAVLNVASGSDFGPPRVIVPAPDQSRYQHLSWPKVIAASDGTIVTAFIAGRKHVNGDGCPAVSLSRDGGESFSSPRILKHFDSSMRYQHGANLALGKATDGALVLMVMAFTDDLRNNIYGWRSEDHGATWARTDTSALGQNRTGSVFGHVFSVPGKGLAVCGHFRKPKGDGVWIAYSKDHGKSWGPPHVITTRKFFEPAFVFASGRLLGLVRENSAHAYHQYISDDLGESWRFHPKVIQGDAAVVHPSPFVVVDPANPGRLLVLQSERSDKREIYLWQADVDTLRWRRRGLLVAQPDAEDFGYPWMTHLGGNDWFVVYYGGEKDGPNSIYGMKITIPSG
ncbi:sialidase family protein [Roseimaritima ulvae]|nr:sialidase family protein [Roseimaritima ulvae]